jgi:hypothetical protein
MDGINDYCRIIENCTDPAGLIIHFSTLLYAL